MMGSIQKKLMDQLKEQLETAKAEVVEKQRQMEKAELARMEASSKL